MGNQLPSPAKQVIEELMNYWLNILEELQHYREPGYICLYTNLREQGHFEEKYEIDDDLEPNLPVKTSPRTQFFLSGLPNNLHLSKREAECVFFLLRGLTIKKVAYTLDLSPRTVEFYLKNVKHKLACKKKNEVLQLIRQTSFVTDPDVSAAMQHLIPEDDGF